MAERSHSLHHAVSDRHEDARQPLRLPRGRRSLAARDAPAPRQTSMRRCRGLQRIIGEFDVSRRRQNPPRGSLRQCRTSRSPASCWWVMPSRPPVRLPAPDRTRCSPTWSGYAASTSRRGLPPRAWTSTRSRRSTTIPSRSACDAWANAKAYHLKSVSIDRGLYWSAQRWARFSSSGSGEGLEAAARRAVRRQCARARRSLLVILVVIVVFIVVVSLSRMMRGAALVVPELAIDAARRQQLRMRAALDRPAP